MAPKVARKPKEEPWLLNWNLGLRKENKPEPDDYGWLKTGITGCTPTLSVPSSGMDVQQ